MSPLDLDAIFSKEPDDEDGEEYELGPTSIDSISSTAESKIDFSDSVAKANKKNLSQDWLSGLADALDPKKEIENARWKPQPGPQEDAFYSLADELFYGGAAGGGKSDLLIGLALSDLSPHKKTIIFRRSFPELKDIVNRATEVLASTSARFKSGNAMRFDGLPDGKSLELGSVPNFGAAQKYKGRPHDLKLFDELSDISEGVYTFLIGWTRTTTPGLRTRVVCAGNPPTNADGQWVIHRWGAWLDPSHMNKAKPGELRWYAMLDGEDTELTEENCPEGGYKGLPFDYENKRGIIEHIKPKSRTFIPARLADNKYLSDGQYESVLMNMPEPFRSQLLYGDFGLSMRSDPYQVIPSEWIYAAQRRWKEAQKDGTLDRSALISPAFGLDVAEAGADKTVLVRLNGPYMQNYNYIEAEHDDPMKQADIVTLHLGMLKRSPIAVDAIGVGIGLGSRLRQLKYTMLPVKVSRSSKKKDKTGQFEFLNLRAELWWRMREALDPHGDNPLAIPDDAKLRAELASAKFERTPNDKLKVEDKVQIKTRLGRSPDIAEALMLALFAQKASSTPLRIL